MSFAPETFRVSTEDTYTNPFDEIPDWYTEPEVEDGQLDPAAPRPPHGGPGSGNVNPTRSTNSSSSSSSAPLLIGLGLIVLGVIAAAMFFGGGESERNVEDLVVGACASDFDTESSALRAATSIECDDFNYGQITAVFEETPEQMPAVGSGFWVGLEQQCEDWAVTPGRYTALAVAETDQEWADGNRTVICISLNA